MKKRLERYGYYFTVELAGQATDSRKWPKSGVVQTVKSLLDECVLWGSGFDEFDAIPPRRRAECVRRYIQDHLSTLIPVKKDTQGNWIAA